MLPLVEQSKHSNLPGGLMIDQVKIENFRCFQEVQTRHLGRFNIVVGDNASGKSAFLEALYLACGNTPQNHLKLRLWRGLTGSRIAINEQAIASGSFWRDLFYQFNQDQPIKIRIQGQPNRSLVVTYQPRSSVALDPLNITAPVAFTWKDASGKDHTSIPRMSDGELDFPNTPRGISGALLTSSVSAQEAAQRFSELSARNLEKPVIRHFCEQFPDIEDLEVLTEEAAGGMIYATVRGFPAKVPVALVSAGVNRWIYMLITIAAFAGGAVFVDEIDNGIYYQRLGDMWRSLDSFSRSNETQIFASTHSREALTAVLPIVEEHEDEFRLVRIERKENQPPRIKIFPGREFAAAIAEGVEVR